MEDSLTLISVALSGGAFVVAIAAWWAAHRSAVAAERSANAAERAVELEEAASEERAAKRAVIARLVELAGNLRVADEARGPRAYFSGEVPSTAQRKREQSEDEALASAEAAVHDFLVAEAPQFLNEWEGAGRSRDRLEVVDGILRELRREAR